MPMAVAPPNIQARDSIEQAEEWSKLMEKNYNHPYKPYDVQRQFMSTVYKCLEEGKVGVLESPTGTVSTQPFTSTLFPQTGEFASMIVLPINVTVFRAETVLWSRASP